MNSFEIGNLTEIQAQYILIRNKKLVFTPINDGSNIDLIFIDDKNNCNRVQIKTANKTATGFRISLYSKPGGKNKKLYTKTDIDFFGTVYNDKLYLIPIEDVENMFTVTLRFNEKYNNQNKKFLAKNYEIM